MVFWLLIACTSAYSQHAPTAAGSAPSGNPAPPVGGGLPFDGPQTSFFGPRQQVQINDLAAAMHSGTISLSLGDKTYAFRGALRDASSISWRKDAAGQYKSSVVNQDVLFWSTYGAETPRAQIFLKADGSFHGTFWVDSHVYLLRGKGSLGTVVEDLNRPTPLKAGDVYPLSRSASAPK